MIQDSLLGQAVYTRMKWLDQRHVVTSTNIANANTPGYIERDVEGYNFKKALSSGSNRVQMAITNDRHIQVSANNNIWNNKTGDTEYETKLTGNSVILEEQAARINQIQAQHQLVNAVYRKQVSLFKMSIRKPG